MAQFVLILLLPSQIDLEQMREHKHALLAHCMQREAEEVWEALVYTLDCWSDVSVQHSPVTYLQK